MYNLDRLGAEVTGLITKGAAAAPRAMVGPRVTLQSTLGPRKLGFVSRQMRHVDMCTLFIRH